MSYKYEVLIIIILQIKKGTKIIKKKIELEYNGSNMQQDMGSQA